MHQVADHDQGALVEEPLLADAHDADALLPEEFKEVVETPLGEFQDDLDVQRLCGRRGLSLVDDRYDVSPDGRDRFESRDQLSGPVFHLELHGYLQKTTC
ncbi:hypothetical protein DSECCO2_503160 [anaerobic digester metagenome]